MKKPSVKALMSEANRFMSVNLMSEKGRKFTVEKAAGRIRFIFDYAEDEVIDDRERTDFVHASHGPSVGWPKG